MERTEPPHSLRIPSPPMRPESSAEPENDASSAKTRVAGVLLAVLGGAMMLLAAFPAIDSAAAGAFTPQELRAGDGGEVLAGSWGDDELYGGDGRDALSAGAGDDFVEVSGGGTDVVRCGSGNDIVNADIADVVSADCETVFRT